MRKLLNQKFYSWVPRQNWAKKLSKHMPFIGFMCLIGVIYIGNSHTAERKMRKIEYVKKDLKEARWEYMTLKADLMKQGTRSEISKELSGQKIGNSGEKPKVIGLNQS